MIFYDELKEGLYSLNIPYQENPRLVHGLDYYNYFLLFIYIDKQYKEDSFKAQMGAEATRKILKNFTLSGEIVQLREELANTN